MTELSTAGPIPASTVQEAVAGDVMAFARIVRAHHDDMARVCHVICGDPDLAQAAREERPEGPSGRRMERIGRS